VGTSSHHVDPHQRGRLDHGTSRDKAVLTGGRRRRRRRMLKKCLFK
jgi:hypothetical protein